MRPLTVRAHPHRIGAQEAAVGDADSSARRVLWATAGWARAMSSSPIHGGGTFSWRGDRERADCSSVRGRGLDQS